MLATSVETKIEIQVFKKVFNIITNKKKVAKFSVEKTLDEPLNNLTPLQTILTTSRTILNILIH